MRNINYSHPSTEGGYMEYNINGSQIKVIRKEEEKGITILDGLIHAFIMEKNNTKKKEEDTSESSLRKQK